LEVIEVKPFYVSFVVQTMTLTKFCAVTKSCKETGYEGQGKRGKKCGRVWRKATEKWASKAVDLSMLL